MGVKNVVTSSHSYVAKVKFFKFTSTKSFSERMKNWSSWCCCIPTHPLCDKCQNLWHLKSVKWYSEEVHKVCNVVIPTSLLCLFIRILHKSSRSFHWDFERIHSSFHKETLYGIFIKSMAFCWSPLGGLHETNVLFCQKISGSAWKYLSIFANILLGLFTWI